MPSMPRPNIQRPRPIESAPALTVYATSRLDNVEPKMEGKIRQLVRHPFAITQFDRNGKAVWPADQFTYRRIRDGDVTLEPPPEPPKKSARSEKR